MNYKVPGVYVEEISTLPPSVAAVATAIPAFIGYTEKAQDKNGKAYPDDEIVVKRIDTLLEYEQYFGNKPKLARFTLEAGVGRYELKRKKADGSTDAPLLHSHLMYYALRMFFGNGGSSCYIVSVDRYKPDAREGKKINSETAESELIKKGIQKLKEYDEPTLIILPDAINLPENDYYARCQEVLAQCNLLKDRFGLFDVRHEDTDASKFRPGIGNNFLKYGAAYMPHLMTSLSYQYAEKDVEVGGAFWQFQSDSNSKTGIKILYPDTAVDSIKPEVVINESSGDVSLQVDGSVLTISGIQSGVTTVADLIAAWSNLTDNQKGAFELIALDNSATLSAEEIQLETEHRQVQTDANGLAIKNVSTSESASVTITEEDIQDPDITRTDQNLNIKVKTGGDTVQNVLAAWNSYNAKGDFRLEQAGDGSANVTATTLNLTTVVLSGQNSNNGLRISFEDAASAGIPTVHITTGDIGFEVTDDENNRSMTISGAGSTAKDMVDAWNNHTGHKGGFSILLDEQSDGTAAVNAQATTTFNRGGQATLDSIKDSFTQLYNQIKTDLTQQRVVLPPSSAMAGIYARIDRDRGVWKAPANVSVSSTIAPLIHVTNADQSRLNVDPTSGKSINVIRSFTGKGDLVWGARTLAGNDNEWRYINVRRLFIFMEESIQKSTAFAVFESNTASTWLKVKAMIDSFLYGLWQQGALAGPTPESAYFVNVGLGKTMTPQDVLEGKLIVEVGVAAVRPAEFIILRFMHKLQEA